MKNYKISTKLIIYSIIVIFVILLISFLFYKPPLKAPLNQNEVISLSILFVVLIIAADKFPIKYYGSKGEGGAEVTVSFALNFSVAFLFNPVLAMAITFVGSTIADALSKKQLYKILFNASMIGLAAGGTSFLFKEFYNANMPLTSIHNLSILIVASILYMLFESIVLFSLLASLTGANFVEFWHYNMKKEALALLSLFPLGMIMIYFFTTNPWMNIFLAPTFIAIYFALRRETEIQEETKMRLPRPYKTNSRLAMTEWG